jgi:threonine-phosphate decarboxylase
MEVHGGNIYAASRDLRCQPASMLDFSASINPLGMAPGAVQVVQASLELATHYPDPDCYELKQALGRFHGIDPECVCIGNGSTELIFLLPKTLALRRALIPGPTFSEYAAAMRAVGGEVSMLLAPPEEEFRIRLSQVAAALQRSLDCVWLCNPNNPTGQLWTKAQVLELWKKARRVGASLIVDEAFIDYCEADSVVSEATSRAGLLVLRSFTKFYGMPGLRVGYLVAEPTVIRRIEAMRLPWSVNNLAQVAAIASLNETSYAVRSRQLIIEERPRLAAALAGQGWVPCPSSANFLLVRLPSFLKSAAVAAATRRQGVLIRDCESFEGMGQQWIRVAVRTAAEHERLVQALKNALALASV